MIGYGLGEAACVIIRGHTSQNVDSLFHAVVFFYYYSPGQRIDDRSGTILPITDGG